MTFLCISCYFKGEDFLSACKAAGNTVFLVTVKELENEPWPREAIDDIFFIEEENSPQNYANMVKGLAWIMRERKIDRVVALDDFDVEKAAYLREEFRIPGMGQTTARLFRDKLAMRAKAAEAGIRIPPFTALFNDAEINEYARTVPAPWVVKPRAEASATGIRKVHNAEQLWEVINELGEDRNQYLLEQFKPGDVYHVDALTKDGKILFVRTSKYLSTPFEVTQGGGVFRTHILEFGSEEDEALKTMNKQLLKAFGMQFSASHTEFIRAHEDGEFYFLETASRVGGAHIAEMVEFSSGINLWGEWANIEDAKAKDIKYKLPKARKDYAGLLVSLSRFQHPDSSSFNDEEVVWRINKDYHIGMIVQSKSRERVLELLDNYAHRVVHEFGA